MELRQVLNTAIERLTFAQVPSPRLNAELLIMFTLDCDRAYLYAHPERDLTSGEMQRYDEVLSRRATGVPTHNRPFNSWKDLIVSPAVLIPRPETEHVVEAVMELIGAGSSQKFSLDQDQNQRQRTGSVLSTWALRCGCGDRSRTALALGWLRTVRLPKLPCH